MTAPGQIFRVTGCPGAGRPERKTTYLAAEAKRHAEHYSPSNVILVSLTKTAAAEIGGRDTGIPETNVATLHGHARRAIEAHDGKAPVLAETAAMFRAFSEACPQYAGEVGRGGEDAAIHGLHEAVAARRARMTDDDEWADDEAEYRDCWTMFKLQHNASDYTDWIERCISDEISPAEMPRVMLVDEAQDLSKLELALVVQWARSLDVTVVCADSLQALFTWRGSDPDALDAIDYAGVKVLDQSYRCPLAVRDLAVLWARQLPSGSSDWKARQTNGGIVSYNAVGGVLLPPSPGLVTEAPYALRDTDEIIDLYRNGCNSAEHTTMVLTSCRYMLAPLCAELKARGIPYHNPWREDEASWNPLAGKGAEALRALLRPVRECHGDKTGMWTWGDLQAIVTPMLGKWIAKGARELIDARCLVDRFGETRRDQLITARDIYEIVADHMPGVHADGAELLLGIAAGPDALRDAVGWWRDNLTAAGYKQAAYALHVLEQYGAGALTATPRLTVGTTHSTKGSEADHVILSPDLSKEAYWQHWVAGDTDATVRMMYVAITRARERLTILEPSATEYAPIGDVLRHGVR